MDVGYGPEVPDDVRGTLWPDTVIDTPVGRPGCRLLPVIPPHHAVWCVTLLWILTRSKLTLTLSLLSVPPVTSIADLWLYYSGLSVYPG